MPKALSLSFDIRNNDSIEAIDDRANFSNRTSHQELSKDDIGTIRFAAELNRDFKVNVAHEAPALAFFGNSVTEKASGGIFFNSSWTSSPQLSLLGTGDALKLSHSISDDTKLDFGFHQSDGFSASASNGAGYLAQTQFSHETANGLSFGLTSAYVSEENSLFSSSSSGAFGSANDNRSLHTSIAASWEVGNKTNIFSTYTSSTVKPSFSGSSIFENWSRLHANSFSIGVTTQSYFIDDDKLGFSIGQPLRVRTAKADVTLPVGRDLSGNVLQETRRLDLAPTGRQIDLQLGYSTKFGSQSGITSFATLSLQPGHNKTAGPRTALGVKWWLEF